MQNNEIGSSAPPASSLESSESEVMTVAEGARLLRVNPKTIYSQIQRGELPGTRRVGRKIRLSRSALLSWLTQGQGRVSRSKEKNQ